MKGCENDTCNISVTKRTVCKYKANFIWSLSKSSAKATPNRPKMESCKDALWTTVIPDYDCLLKDTGKPTSIRRMKKDLENSFVPLIFQYDKFSAFSFNKEILEKRREMKRRMMSSQGNILNKYIPIFFDKC